MMMVMIIMVMMVMMMMARSPQCAHYHNNLVYKRADFGVTGVGRHCHACSGPGGRCRGPEDGGVALDCGEGVTTCTLAFNSECYLCDRDKYLFDSPSV